MSDIATLKAVPTARGGWPLLGHFVLLRRTPLQFMDSLREYGDLVRIKVGPVRFVVACSARSAQARHAGRPAASMPAGAADAAVTLRIVHP